MIKPYWYINWKDYWITTENIEFTNLKGEKEIIPKDFITDFGSYPRFIRIFYTPLNLTYLLANMQHDRRYSKKDTSWMTRQQIDNEYLENGRKYWRVFPIIAFLWVRLFGKKHFKKDLSFDKKSINLNYITYDK
jgi:hypothetical protein